jgi:hypothetical protein
MLIKNLLKNVKNQKNSFYEATIKNFSTNGSTSLRFHELYVKELERIQKNSYFNKNI